MYFVTRDRLRDLNAIKMAEEENNNRGQAEEEKPGALSNTYGYGISCFLFEKYHCVYLLFMINLPLLHYRTILESECVRPVYMFSFRTTLRLWNIIIPNAISIPSNMVTPIFLKGLIYCFILIARWYSW